MDSRKRNLVALAVSLSLIVGSVVAFWPLDTRITKGLDIQGGLSVILTAKEAGGEPVTSADLDRAEMIVANRVNKLGASEATVQRQGNDSILVQIPGIEDADSALAALGSTGKLEFVELASIEDSAAVSALIAGTPDVELEEGTYTAFMDGTSVKSAGVSQSESGRYEVNVKFDSEGADVFAEVTGRLAPTYGQIAIVLDGVVRSAPQVESVISDGNVAITGSFTVDEAKNLAMVLETGSLPVALEFSESRVVGPTLGAESLQQGILAAGIGLALVAVYLLVFYRGLGLVTVAAMAMFSVIYLGVLALLSRNGMFALSLPGIAGIVLTIGIAADSSILILERLREEIQMGRSVKAASMTGVRHAVGTSIDADMVTMVSAFVLFVVAIGPVKGFGLTLGIGILCDIVVMLLFKAPLLRLMADSVLVRSRGFWGLPAGAERRGMAKGGGRRG